MVGSGGINPFTIASSTGTQLLTVTPSGNVGIGTTSPQSVLNISGASALLRIDNTTAGSGNPGINIHNSAGTIKASFGY